MAAPVLTTTSALLRDLHAHCDLQTPEQSANTRQSLLAWTNEREREQLLRMPTSGGIQ